MDEEKLNNTDFEDDSDVQFVDVIIEQEQPIQNVEEQEEEEIPQDKLDEMHIEDMPGDVSLKSFVMPDGTPNYQYKEYVRRASSIFTPRKNLSSAPSSVRKSIYKKLILALILFLLGLGALIVGIKNIGFTLGLWLFAVIALVAALRNYGIVEDDDVTTFEGIVVGAQIVGIVKATKYMNIKISNSEKFLNINTPLDKKIRIGTPITVYIPKDEPVINTEDGPFVEHYISYTLSVDNSSDIEKMESDELTAEEYIKTKE